MRTTQAAARGAKRGDLVVIPGHRIGEAKRLGEILEVLGEPGHQHYRVRWEEGRESIFYPDIDAFVRPARVKPPSRRRKQKREGL